MDELRSCLVCGADLEGPYGPEVTLARSPAPPAASGVLADRLAAEAWVCPGCGLVSWYVEREQRGKPAQALDARPGEPYERRAQMLRLLRRVRRI